MLKIIHYCQKLIPQKCETFVLGLHDSAKCFRTVELEASSNISYAAEPPKFNNVAIFLQSDVSFIFVASLNPNLSSLRKFIHFPRVLSFSTSLFFLLKLLILNRLSGWRLFLYTLNYFRHTPGFYYSSAELQRRVIYYVFILINNVYSNVKRALLTTP